MKTSTLDHRGRETPLVFPVTGDRISERPAFKRLRMFLYGLLALLGVSRAPAQSSYEIIEARLPDVPPGKTIVHYLNNSGQVAGTVLDENNNRAGNFIARWAPGATQLSAVQMFPNDLFTAPPGYTSLGWIWEAFFDSGEGYAVLRAQRDLNPVFETWPAGFEAHPANGLLRRYKYFARILRYSGGVFTPVKEFESFHPTGQILTSGETMVRFLDHEFGGDDGDNRYPRAGEWYSHNPHLPHYPEVFTMHHPGGGSTPLSTGIDVLSHPGDYRYQTFFVGIDDSGTLYGRASFRAHPLTSFGRPYTRTTREVWRNGSPQAFADFAPPWGQGFGFFPGNPVNRGGEITGAYAGRLAIYLPRPNYGMSAGIHTLTTAEQLAPTSASRLNRQGALVWGTANAVEGSLWSGGVHTTLNSLVAPGATPQLLNGNQALLNDLGWICTQGRNPTGPADTRQWLMRPAFTAEASLSTDRLFTGETFTFTLRVHNMTGTPRTLGLPIGFRFSGDAQFQLVGASTPPGSRIVPAFGSFEVRQEIMATNAGTSIWRSQGRLFSGGTSNNTAVAYTGTLRVLDRADLLIKRAGEPGSAYGVDNEYQSMPAGPQVRTNSVVKDEPSEFHVLVQNDDDKPRTFRLKADEGANAEGWEVKHLVNGIDLSPAIRSGHVLPELAAGQSHQVTLQVTGSTAPPGEPKRVLYTLEEATEPGEIRDVVEAVTELGGEIIVNSTGDEADADPLDDVADVDLDEPGLQTTLRAAIDLANRREGKDVIKFDIEPEGNTYEDGVATFHPESALPDVTDPVTIDGWSQDPDATHPPIQLRGLRLVRPELDPGRRISRLYAGDNHALWPNPQDFLLDWPGAASGLHLVAGESEVRGLVINHFPLCGILVDGPNCTIQGNYLGIDPSGQRSRGNGYGATDGGGNLQAIVIKGADLAVRSSGNLIGGPGPRGGNVISGRSGQPAAAPPFVPSVNSGFGTDRYGVGSPLILLSGAAAIGNRIQSNILGLTATGEGLAQPEKVDHWFEGPLGGIFEYLSSGTVIGGPAPGEGNVVAGNAMDILSGNRCSIMGNIVGANQTMTRSLSAEASRGGIAVSGESPQVGSQEPGAANILLSGGISLISATNAVVRGNRIGLGANGLSFPNPIDGIEVSASHASIIDGNWVTRRERGIVLSDSQTIRISGNTITNNLKLGILVHGGSNSVITQNQVVDNGRSGSNPAGIRIARLGDLPPPQGIHITQNSITGNHGFGISFQPEDTTTPAPTENDHGDSDAGPNGQLNHPQLANAIQDSNGVLHVSGGFGSRLGQQPYILEFFASPKASPTGFGEGASFLQSLETVTNFAGQSTFSLSIAAPPVVGHYLTSTATDAEANTSEFSRAILIQGATDSDTDGMSDEVEQGVPNRPTQSGGGVGPMSNNGDGNGDGVPDAQQAQVTSFPTLNGDWWTLASDPDVALLDVSPAGPPDFASLPAGYAFPVGFVSATLSGLPAGGTVTLTNILNRDIEVTTVFAYGPGPGQPQPHWYQLPATVVDDEIRLTFTDGGGGDHDLAANGRITTIYALAYLLPPGPALKALGHSTDLVSRTSPALVNGQIVFVTNQVRQVTLQLGWPSDATNWALEYADDLAPGALWRTVLEEPVTVGGQNVVTTQSTEPRRFFRLRRR